jgi:DNA-binding NarL/FixJ family response regulator
VLTTYDIDEYVCDALEAGTSGLLLKDAATTLAKDDFLDAAIADLS